MTTRPAQMSTARPGPGVDVDVDDEGWVTATLARLTLDEQVSLCAGADDWTTVPIDRVGVPALKVTDGPNGARGTGTSSASAACYPVGIALGATWNPKLLEEIGGSLAREARSKGAQVLLGPTVNLHRSPLGGRNFECYSEDPLLTAHLAAAFVAGLQAGGVGACIKHFVGNESEFERFTISSEIPEQALRELYLMPFEHAVRTVDPWAVMGAYNRVAGDHACANDRLLNWILKGEWRFPGVVISDWGALRDTVAGANGGCDLEMPGPARRFGGRLREAVDRGAVAEAVVADKARRVLRMLWRSGQVREPVAFDEWADDRTDDRALIRRAAAESMVLLVNRATDDGSPVLPLDPASVDGVIAVVGPNAQRATVMGGGSSMVRPHHLVHPLQALQDRFGADRVVHTPGGTIDRHLPQPEPGWFRSDHGPGLTMDYVDTDDLSAEPADLDPARVFGTRAVSDVTRLWWVPPDGALDRDRWAVRWTGTFVPDVDGVWSFGVGAIGRARVLVDGDVICDNWTSPEPGGLFVGLGSTEVRGRRAVVAGVGHRVVVEYQPPPRARRAAIRFGMAPPENTDPIAVAVAAARGAEAAVVVVGTNGDWETEGSDRPSMRLPGRQDELVEAVAAVNPRTVVVLNTGSPVEMPWCDDVGAIVQAWFGGQEMGDALVDVLTGVADPGGRLPTTFPVRYEDNPTVDHYPGALGEVVYGEGVFVGYRAYTTHGPSPLFPFGHGLSYTSFELGAPSVTAADGDAPSFSVVVPVTNIGDRPGSTVVQLYVRPPRGEGIRRPDRELKAFGKVHLRPGETAEVSIALDHRSFAAFDPAVPGWVSEAGVHELLVGTSSAAIAAVVPVELGARVVVAIEEGA